VEAKSSFNMNQALPERTFFLLPSEDVLSNASIQNHQLLFNRKGCPNLRFLDVSFDAGQSVAYV
jgi:hypothetical protein